MNFRILLILLRLYRRWAGLRLKDLAWWVRSWQLHEMYVGLPGGGSELAWWHVGITREGALHDSSEMLAGALDIFKRFDQIRSFLFWLKSSCMLVDSHGKCWAHSGA